MGIAEIIKEGEELLAEKSKKTETVAASEEKAAPVVAKVEEAPVAKEAAPKSEEAPAAEEEKETLKAEPVKDEAKLEKAIDTIEDDESEPKPDEKGNITLPFKAFKTRITRASKAALRSVFGTDNREEILKMKEGYEKMLSDRESERRAKLAAEERAKEDLDKANRKIQELESREQERQEARAAEAEEKRINAIATKYVDDGALDLAHYKFAKYLKKLSKDDLDEFDDTRIEDWYKRWSTKNTKYAKAAPPPKEEKKVPVNVGASPAVKPSPKGTDMQKTAARGHANSMSDEEWRAYKRQHNINY